MRTPDQEHIPAIVRSIRAEIAHEQGVNVGFLPYFDIAEIEAIQHSYAEHKNVRIVRSQVMSLLASRNTRKH